MGKYLVGANGLVAASDIVIAEETSSFAFTEVRLGLVPATIAPYILAKLGYSRTTELMLTGRTFDASDALAYGLVHQCCRMVRSANLPLRPLTDFFQMDPEP